MAVTFDTTNFNDTITDGQTNSGIPTEEESLKGIVYNSYSDAVIINKFLYNISSALEYIQSNGSLLWQKGKGYKLGSVVNAIEQRNNFFTLRKFQCIKVDAGDVTKQQPLIGTLNQIPNNLSTYYTGVTGVNTTYWIELFDKDDQIIQVDLPERSQGLSLFDIPMTGHYMSNFDISIKRYNTNTRKYDSIRFTVQFECNNYNGNKDNLFISIYNVNCTNYKRTSFYNQPVTGDLIDMSKEEYVFGDNKFALLGITVSTKNDKFNIDIYSSNNAYIDPNKKIEIELTINKTEINFIPTELQQYNGFTGEDVLVIREGIDNSGTDCGYIIESTTRYTAEEQFKQGLLLITDDNCISDLSERPGFSKNFQYQFDPDKTVSVISDKTTKDYSSHILPLFEGELYSLPGYKGWDYSWLRDESTSSLLSGVNKINFRDHFIETGFKGTTYPVYIRKMTMSVTSNDKTKNIFNSKNPELNVITHKPTLYPKSVRVYRYFKY